MKTLLKVTFAAKNFIDFDIKKINKLRSKKTSWISKSFIVCFEKISQLISHMKPWNEI